LRGARRSLLNSCVGKCVGLMLWQVDRCRSGTGGSEESGLDSGRVSGVRRTQLDRVASVTRTRRATASCTGSVCVMTQPFHHRRSRPAGVKLLVLSFCNMCTRRIHLPTPSVVTGSDIDMPSRRKQHHRSLLGAGGGQRRTIQGHDDPKVRLNIAYGSNK
jgi:hypothetical protein